MRPGLKALVAGSGFFGKLFSDICPSGSAEPSFRSILPQQKCHGREEWCQNSHGLVRSFLEAQNSHGREEWCAKEAVSWKIEVNLLTRNKVASQMTHLNLLTVT